MNKMKMFGLLGPAQEGTIENPVTEDRLQTFGLNPSPNLYGTREEAEYASIAMNFGQVVEVELTY
jgi:hypothetical protein